MPAPPVHRGEGLRRGDVQAAFEGQETHELRDLAARLLRDGTRLEGVLRELQAQQQSLQQDNAGIRSTIEMMIGHLKSNVNAHKLPETRQPDNPLDVLGRFWERVRPRNSGILVSEHIGEIRRPRARAPELPLAAFGQRVTDRLTGAMGLPPVSFGDAASLLTATSHDGLKPGRREGLRQRKGAKSASKAAADGSGDGAVLSSFLTLMGVGAGAAAEETAAHEPSAYALPKAPRGASSCSESTEEGSAPVMEDGSTTVTSAASTARAWTSPSLEEEALRTQIEEALAGPVAGEDCLTGRPAAEEEAQATPAAPAPPDAPLPSASSSVLIEATLTLDEVCLAVCRVHATDRCGEVAARFIDEHSLKPCFKAPLTAWLKKAEADAETFPVILEADLMDLRNRYSLGA